MVLAVAGGACSVACLVCGVGLRFSLMNSDELRNLVMVEISIGYGECLMLSFDGVWGC